MRRKIWPLVLSVALLAGLLMLATSFFLDARSTEVYFEKGKREAAALRCTETEDANFITGWAAPTSRGHFITDIIEYEVAVFFCAEIEVDENRLVKAVNLSPFEMVGKPKISHGVLHNGTRKLLTLTYTIQALRIVPGKEYAFPHIQVEYISGSKGRVYWIRDVSPIYISWIISPDSVVKSMEGNGGIEFQPLKPELASRSTLLSKSWFLIGGSVLLALGLAGVLYPTVLRRRVKTPEPRDPYKTEVLGILQGIESQAETNVRASMHRLHNLTLELLSNPVAREVKEAIQEVGSRAEELAYAKDAPPDAQARAREAIRSIRDIVSKLPRPEDRRVRKT